MCWLAIIPRGEQEEVVYLRGVSPEEYAERKARSLHTVRSQIKSLKSKMGVKRITQAVSKVWASPASFAPKGEDE